MDVAPVTARSLIIQYAVIARFVHASCSEFKSSVQITLVVRCLVTTLATVATVARKKEMCSS